ncbi:MAG: Flp pilus assembly protein CpaB [Thiotrichales bacterium]|nr:Flp pilus assembly protein CpaB [Thiotrichales bacterium]
MKVSRSDLILYSVALVSAIAVAVLVYAYIEKRIADAQSNLPVKTIKVVEKPELAPVLVASRDLFRGEKVETDDVQVLMIAKEGIVLKDVFAKPEQVVGKVIGADIFAGEWFFARKFQLKADDPQAPIIEGVGALVDPGMRAMRVPVSAESGLLGILMPGDHVDVLSVFPSASGDRLISRIILQNIEVLSIGQASRFKPQNEVEKTEQSGGKQDETVQRNSMVALHVALQQAEELALAMKVGTVQLLLRNKTDAEVKDSDGVNLKVIESLKQAPTGVPAKSERQTIELLQGGVVEKVKVQ